MNRFKFSGVPITDADGRLVGILTNRDIRFCSGADFDRPVTEFMTSTGWSPPPVGTTLEQAKAILQKHRIEKLPLVDADSRLIGLITVKDIHKRQEFPNATRDSAGRLRCAAAVGVGADLEAACRGACSRRAVDAVAIDTAHGHSAGVIKAIERIKSSWPTLAVVAGNVVTEDGVDALAAAGADAIKVGVGAGSICTTRVVSGAGMPQLSAIYFTCKQARKRGIPIIADGGITYSGDIVKAIAAGADDGDARLAAGRHRRGAGRARAVRGPPLQELPRHGLDGGDAGPRRRPLRQRRSPSLGSSRPASWCRKASRAGSPTPARSSDVIYQLVGGLRSGMGYAGAARCRPARRPLHEGHHRRSRGEPPARRDHHQGSPQLPARRFLTLVPNECFRVTRGARKHSDAA